MSPQSRSGGGIVWLSVTSSSGGTVVQQRADTLLLFIFLIVFFSVCCLSWPPEEVSGATRVLFAVRRPSGDSSGNLHIYTYTYTVYIFKSIFFSRQLKVGFCCEKQQMAAPRVSQSDVCLHPEAQANSVGHSLREGISWSQFILNTSAG